MTKIYWCNLLARNLTNKYITNIWLITRIDSKISNDDEGLKSITFLWLFSRTEKKKGENHSEGMFYGEMKL